MKIIIVYDKDHPESLSIESACKTMNTVQRSFHFVTEKDNGTVLNGKETEPIEFLKQNADSSSRKIYITDRQFRDNWFSHENKLCAIISTYSWNERFSPPSVLAFIMYQCAQAALGFAAEIDESIAMNFVHFRPEGCMFDMCADKSEIKLGMVSGAICTNCEGLLRRYGTNQEYIDAAERILEYVRAQAIGKPIVINNAAFVVMRFTTNDENDHTYLYGIKPAFRELGIYEERADAGVEPRQLLEKIRNKIDISRFIVAKVDEMNLNVYFELGLAMGLNKDVLLISEESLVVDLPTDLKNWECLTYPRGDFETLKKRIIKFYREYYHIQ